MNFSYTLNQFQLVSYKNLRLYMCRCKPIYYTQPRPIKRIVWSGDIFLISDGFNDFKINSRTSLRCVTWSKTEHDTAETANLESFEIFSYHFYFTKKKSKIVSAISRIFCLSICLCLHIIFSSKIVYFIERPCRH